MRYVEHKKPQVIAAARDLTNGLIPVVAVDIYTCGGTVSPTFVGEVTAPTVVSDIDTLIILPPGGTLGPRVVLVVSTALCGLRGAPKTRNGALFEV